MAMLLPRPPISTSSQPTTIFCISFAVAVGNISLSNGSAIHGRHNSETLETLKFRTASYATFEAQP
jgi:hypothetical protein